MFSVFDLVPAFIAFGITAALGPVIIPFLIRLKAGQTERELGVEAHKKKTGTPTMGGIMFLVAITVAVVVYLVVSEMKDRKRLREEERRGE